MLNSIAMRFDSCLVKTANVPFLSRLTVVLFTVPGSMYCILDLGRRLRREHSATRNKKQNITYYVIIIILLFYFPITIVQLNLHRSRGTGLNLENNNILLSHYGYNILYYKQHLTYT